MVTPEALLEFEAANATGGGAAVHAVEPAVGAPSEMVRHRLGIFHAKASEQHFGIAIGDIVAIGVGIVEQVGRVEDIDTAVAKLETGGDVESIDEIFGAVSVTVAIFVFQDCDAVGAARAARRRLGNAVIFGARPAIDFHALETGRIGVLEILDGPEPATIIAFYEC